MDEQERKHLDAYRDALANLVQQNGGHLVVKTPLAATGTLMWRRTAEGVEFRYVEDGPPS